MKFSASIYTFALSRKRDRWRHDEDRDEIRFNDSLSLRTKLRDDRTGSRGSWNHPESPVIIRRKLHGDFRARLPIRLAFHDFANPRLGREERPRDRRPNDYPSVSDVPVAIPRRADPTIRNVRNVRQPMQTLSRKTILARGFPRIRHFRAGERWPKIGGARPVGTKGGCWTV